MKKFLTSLFVVTLVFCLFGCRNNKDDEDLGVKNPNLDESEEIVLKIAGSTKTYEAFSVIGDLFTKKYPNCTVAYEFIDKFETNILIRLEESPETVDLFITDRITATSDKCLYSLDLLTVQDKVDLSTTHDGLVNNFKLTEEDVEKLYSIPMGGEVRGVFVNKTLLKSLNLEIPKNLDEFLNVCQKVKESGKIAIFKDPGSFAQQLTYPYMCNNIVNTGDYTENFNLVNNCDDKVIDFVREPLNVIYTMVANDYYNYNSTRKYFKDKYSISYNIDDNIDHTWNAFFNAFLNDKNEYVKRDGTGDIAFVLGTMANSYSYQKIKEDLRSSIEYEFILTPVTDKGGFAYLSPARGLAVNKNGQNVDWTLEFLSFMYKENIMEKFAEADEIIPNVSDAFNYMVEKFNIPSNQMSHLGQATFKYNFYNMLNKADATPDNTSNSDSIMNMLSKANNPKYMKLDPNGTVDYVHKVEGVEVTDKVSLYSFDYYMELLEGVIKNNRESLQ